MKTGDQVWYSVSRTCNIGNYESFKFEIGESRSVGDETPDDVYKALKKDVNGRLSVIMKKIKKDTESQ